MGTILSTKPRIKRIMRETFDPTKDYAMLDVPKGEFPFDEKPLVEGKPIIGIKNLSGEVYHIPAPDVDTSNLTLCNTEIASKVLALRFEDINNPNICRHCAMQAIRRGA